MPITKLLTFGGGNKHYHQAVDRVIIQSKLFNEIDEAIGYTNHTLPINYVDQYYEIESRFPKGCGLWSWKPFLVDHELDKLELGDILIYVDAGCELNINGKERFSEYLSHTAKYETLLFELPNQNRFWTKNNSLLTGNIDHYYRNQISASCFFIKKSVLTVKIVKDWLALTRFDDFELLKDPLGSEKQIKGYLGHRHDQSCLSTIIYKNNLIVIKDETYYENWTDGDKYPILAMRNRTGKSKLPKNSYFKIIKYFK